MSLHRFNEVFFLLIILLLFFMGFLNPKFLKIPQSSLNYEAIQNNPKPVHEYKDGNPSSINFIMGQVMKISKGKANPSTVMEILKNKLS